MPRYRLRFSGDTARLIADRIIGNMAPDMANPVNTPIDRCAINGVVDTVIITRPME